MSRDRWYQNIPSAVLDEERKTERAKAWHRTELAKVAGAWEDVYTRQANEILDRYTAYPGQLPGPAFDPNVGDPFDDLTKTGPTEDGIDWAKMVGSSGRVLDEDPALPTDKLTRYQGGEGAVPEQAFPPRNPLPFDPGRPDPFSPSPPLPPQMGPVRLPVMPAGLPPPSGESQEELIEGRADLGKIGERETLRTIGKQGEHLPGAAEGMPTFRLGADDAARARAFAQGAVDVGGDVAGPGLARGAGDVVGAGGAMGAPRRLDVPGEVMGETPFNVAPTRLPRANVARRLEAKLPPGPLRARAAETLADIAETAPPARALDDPGQIAARLGVEPETLAKRWDEADGEDAGTLRALVAAMDGKTSEMMDLADDVGDGSYSAAARFALAIEDWRALQGVASGTDQKAAAFLPSRRRRLVGALESGDPQAMRQRIVGVEDKTRRIAAMVGALRDRPEEIPAVLRAALADEKEGAGAWARAAFYTALLSSPWTHVRNMVSNTAMTGIDTAMRPAYVAADAALAVAKRRQRVMSLNEAPAQAVGALLGLRVGWTNAIRAFSDPEVFDAVSKLELRHGGGGGLTLGADSSSALVRGAGQALSITGRALAAGDALSRGVNTLARSYGEAARLVAKMPDYAGRPVTDPEVWRKVTEVAGRLPRAAAERVGRATDELVFQDAGKLNETITKVRDRIPLGWTQLPFAGTPTNIWKATIKYTFGPNPSRWAELKAGDPIEQAETVGRALVAASIATAAWVAAENGVLVGSAPDFGDPDRDQWLAENQQRSFKIPDGEGGYRFVAYKDVLSVFAPLLTAVADAHRELRYTKKPEDAAGRAIAGFVTALAEVPFVPEIVDDVRRWLSGEGGDIEDVARGLVRPIESVAAPALARFGTRAGEQIAGEPLVRDTTTTQKGLEGFAEGMANRVRANYPGATHLPPRLDLFGEPVKRQAGETLSPIMAGTRKGDPILQELTRLRTVRDPETGETIGSSLRTMSRTQRGKRLDPWAYHHIQRAAGQATRAGLETLLASEEYQTARDGTKVKKIKDLVGKVRKDALDTVLGETPRTPPAARTPTPTRTSSAATSRTVDPERSAGARRAADTRKRNATATAVARR